MTQAGAARAARTLDAARRVTGLAVLLVLPILALETFLLAYGDPALATPTKGWWSTPGGNAVAALLVLAVLAHAALHLGEARREGRTAPGTRRALHASAVLLAALAAVHVASVLWFADRFPDDAFTALTSRLSNPFWRFLDWTTFLVAALHGTATLAVLVRDRVLTPGWREGATWSAVALGAFVALLATFAFLTLPLFPRNPLYGGP